MSNCPSVRKYCVDDAPKPSPFGYGNSTHNTRPSIVGKACPFWSACGKTPDEMLDMQGVSLSELCSIIMQGWIAGGKNEHNEKRKTK